MTTQSPTLSKLDTPAKLPPPDIQDAITELTLLLKEAATWDDGNIDSKKRLLNLTVLVHDSLLRLQWDQEPIKPAIHAWFSRLGDPSLPWDGYAESLDVSFFRTKSFQDLVDKQMARQGGRKRKVAFVEVDLPKPKKRSSLPTEESSGSEVKTGTKRARDTAPLNSSRKSKNQNDPDKDGEDGTRVSKKKKQSDGPEGQGSTVELAEGTKSSAKATASKPQSAKEPKSKVPRKEKIDANDIKHYDPTDLDSRCSNCRKDDKTCWKRKSGDFACWTCFKSKLGACDFSAISRPSKKKLSNEGESRTKPSDKRLTGPKSKQSSGNGAPAEVGEHLEGQMKTKVITEAGEPVEEKAKQSTSKLSEHRQDTDEGRTASKTKPSDAGEVVQAPAKLSTPKLSRAETIANPTGDGENREALAKGPTSKTENTDAGVKKSRAPKATERAAVSKTQKKKALPVQQASKDPNGEGRSISEDEDATYVPTDLENAYAEPRRAEKGPQHLERRGESDTSAPATSGGHVEPGVPRNPAPSWTRVTPAYPGELMNGSVEAELQAANLRLHHNENRARELTASVNTVVRSVSRQNEAEKKIPQLEEQLSKAFREITELRRDLDAEKKKSEAQMAKLNEQETTISHYANNVNLLTSVVNKLLLGTPPTAASIPLHSRLVHRPGASSMRNTDCEQPPLPRFGYHPQPDTNAPPGGHSQFPSACSTSNTGPAPGSSSLATSATPNQTSRFPLPPQAASHASTAFDAHFNQEFRHNLPNPVIPDYPQNISGASNHPMQTLLSEYQRSTMEFPPEMQQSPARDVALAEMMVNSAAGRSTEVIQAIQGCVAATGGAVSDNSSVGTPDWPALGGKVGRPGQPPFRDPGTYVDDGFGNASYLQGSSSSSTPSDFLGLSSNPPIDFQASSIPTHCNGGAGPHHVGTTGFMEGSFGNSELYQQDLGGGTNKS
ncbi:hypothetical protein CC2G_013348 [Coprinopsis cinerea AmutBmut pab1-1]|nr:hypothetical protein CC2G_013348 [Coprinopsis cinerea AmutBmut pab1-1]